MIAAQEDPKVKSLFKALKLLDCFVGVAGDLGVTELSEKTGMLKSSVHNVLSTYEMCGYVERNPQTNRYRLGAKFLVFSNQFYQHNDIRQLIRPYAEQIAAKTDETVYLAELLGNNVIYIDAIYPVSHMGGRNVVGIRASTYCTGIGKALLAYQSQEFIDGVIKQGLKRYTDHTITDPVRLMEELSLIRSRGYAVDNMEHEFGIKCVAAPIRNCQNEVVAALSVSGPSPRFSDAETKRYADLLIETAARLPALIQ